MRILSWNVNSLGRRLAELKELAELYEPDFICLQKVRCDSSREKHEIDGYVQMYSVCDYGSMSGVTTYAKIAEDAVYPWQNTPQRVHNSELSAKGHSQCWDCGEFYLLNVYVPYANREIEGAAQYRLDWDKKLILFCRDLSKQKPLVICGDMNIVSQDIDDHSGKSHKNEPCYTETEHQTFDVFFSHLDMVDAFRELHPVERKYSYFSQSFFRMMNMGSRIDYFIVSRSLMPCVSASDVLSDIGSAQSAPILLDLNLGVPAEPSGYRDETSSHGLDQEASIPNTSESETIPVKDAARWLATMAATDGVVSPSERKLLKEFAETYKLDASSLFRMAHAIANKVDTPEVESVNQSEMKGRKFEEFVVSLCSDKSRFDLLAWRGDKISGDTYALENLLPDLHLRHRLDEDEVEYLVECKYRSSWGDDGIDLSSQYARYHNAAKDRDMELFIALGVGGTPSDPDELYIIPGRMVKLDKKIDPDRFFKCRCSKDPEAFHNYINHYFNKRVFKKL